MAVKIKFDKDYNAIEPTFVLGTRSGKKIGPIPAVNISVGDAFNSNFDLEFKVYKENNGEVCEYWDKIVDFKFIWCREWDTWFEIYVKTEEDSSGIVKTITGVSVGEAELSQIYIYNTEINTEDDIARDDYVVTVLYNEDNAEGSLLDRIMEKAPHYTINYVSPSIKNIQRTFSFDGVTIIDAFNEIAEEIDCIFVIDSGTASDGSIAREINVYDLESYCVDCGYRGDFDGDCPDCGSDNILTGYGDDTTIFISSENLADSITFETDTDSVKNCFRLEAGDDLMTATVINCNPNGTQYLWYLNDDTREDMTDELNRKLAEYDELYEYYQNDYVIELDSDILAEYNALIEKYQQYDSSLSTISDGIVGYPELMNVYYDTIDFYLLLTSSLMPSVDIFTTSAEEQAALLTAENLSPVAVQSLDTCSTSTANSAVLAVAKVIANSTVYQIKVGDGDLSDDGIWTGYFTVTSYSDDEDTATSDTISIYITDDYETYVEQLLMKALGSDDDDEEALDISALFELDLEDFTAELERYCLASLNTFADSCQACLDILIEQGIADDETWADSDPDMYEEVYVPYYNKLLAIQAEIQVREAEIEIIEGVYDTDGNLEEDGIQTIIVEARQEIQETLDMENYLGTDLWLELSMYRREDTYSNSNYISDGLDNGELFQYALQFIEVAEAEIYKSATLQHSITSTLKNLLVMPEFEAIVDYFSVGNWIRIKVDDTVYKLRLIYYSIDFDDLDNLSIEFSDVKICANSSSDIESVLAQATSMASSYSAVMRQASQGSSSNALLEDWVNKGLSLTTLKIVNSADNQAITYDEHGLLCREYLPLTDEYDDKQLKIINKGVYLTDDNWLTSKAGIGNFTFWNPKTGEYEESYGVIADKLVGNLILSEEIGIYTTTGSFSFDENGLVITAIAEDDDDTYSSTSVFKICKQDSNGVVTDQLYIDSDGNLVLSNGAKIMWGNIDLADLILTSSNIDMSTVTITSDNIDYESLLAALMLTSDNIDTSDLTLDGVNVYVNVSVDSDGNIVFDFSDYGTVDENVVTDDDGNTTTSLYYYMYAYYSYIENLTATNINAIYAEIEELQADYITAAQIYADYIETGELYAEEIDADSISTNLLTAAAAAITSLDAYYAKISTLLTTTVSSDNIEVLYLTASNAVIDDAAITSLSASKLTSGTIYTNYIDIQTDEDDQSLFISGSLIQMTDENSTVRVQIGQDGQGNYNYYLWDSDGTLLFDAAGITSDGISDGLIVDAHISSKTSTYTGISSDKLNIDDLVTTINEDGSYTFESTIINVDGDSLEYKLTQITQAIEYASSAYTAYYCLWYSSDEAPPTIDSDYYDCTADNAVIDYSYIDVSDAFDLWSTEYTTPYDDLYVWVCYANDVYDSDTDTYTTTYSDPVLYTGDPVARETSETLTTQLEVVQGNIDLLISYTDIEAWEDSGTTIYNAYSNLSLELDNITATVAEIESEYDDNYEYLDERITSVELTADGLTSTVTDLTTYAITGHTSYYAVWTEEEPPGYEDELVLCYTAYTDDDGEEQGCLTDVSYLNVTNGIWFEEWSAAGDGLYTWITEKIETGIEGTDTYTVTYTDPVIFSGDPQVTELIDAATTEIIQEAESIILSALAVYATTTDLSEFKSTVETSLSVMAGEIEMEFTEITSSTSTFESNFEELYKYIRFSTDGIEIGESGNSIILTIDNDMIAFTKDGEVIGYWDGDNFYTGNIYVEVSQYARFGNFQWLPRSDGSLMLLKVGE